MILTGPHIRREVEAGTITLDPFDPISLNPNSYNYRLGRSIKVKRSSPRSSVEGFYLTELPDEGFELKAGSFALGHTLEVIGSSKYAMSLIGRSSIGRLGLFLQVSANLGHTASVHRWTLELFAVRNLMIYPEMHIGQVSFWTNSGTLAVPRERYSAFNDPCESLEGDGVK